MLRTYSPLAISCDYDGPLDPPCHEEYDNMVDSVCDMSAKRVKEDCDEREIDITGKTIDQARDLLIDSLRWELDL